MRRGTRVGQAYVAVTADGDGINEDIVDAVDEAGPGVEKAGKEHGERYGDEFGDSLRVRFSHAADKAGEELNRRLAESGDDGGEEYGEHFEKSFKKMAKRIGQNIGKTLGQSLSETLEDSFASLIDMMEERLREVSRNNTRTVRAPTKGPSIGDRTGALFGDDSRNNGLNLLGSSIKNIVNLMESARSGVSSFFGTFVEGFKNADEGASIFRKTLSGFSGMGSAIGGALTSLTAAAPAAAAAAGVVLVTLSALASVAGALVALATALTSTIASGLVGALLVAGPLIGALVVGAGLLTAAFMSMTDAQKSLLKDAFQPLKAEFTGLGQVLITEMVPYFKTWSTNLQEALLLVAPLAQVMGTAFGEAGASLTKALSGPGFVRFWAVMKTELPLITTNLSTAFGSFLNGVMGIFAALTPLVTRFSDYLVKVTDRFAEWANSTEGQNAIVDFADRAVDSLKSLWGFVKEFSGFISDVLFSPEAQGTGNTMFDSLADSFRGFRDAIEKYTKNGELKKWFEDAIKFGGDLKDIIIGLKDTFKALYNSNILQLVTSALKGQVAIIKVVNKILGTLVDYFGVAIPGVVGGVESAFGAIKSAIGWVSDAAHSAYDWVVSLINKINDIPALPDIGGGAGNFLSGVGGTLGSILPGGSKTMMPGLFNKGGADPTNGGGGDGGPKGLTLAQLIAMGNAALNASGGGSGKDGSGKGGSGKDGDKKKKDWKNPYIKWANSLIKEGPALAAVLRRALISVNKEISRALAQADSAVGADEARSILTTQIQSIREAARSGVDTARDALNSAASSLASANGPKEAMRALKAVLQAQKDLKQALDNQKKMNKAATLLAKQKVVSPENVEKLLAGLKVQNATLADFATARAKLAVKIEEANAQLAEAIQLRDSYRTQVSDSIKSFGALTTAQASVIDGIEQALTSGDITSNLQTRLEKIRAFQDNLRILLAQGLSNDAYKQILDQGVEGGSAYAAALVQGGVSAVSQVNGLVSQINSMADGLGLEASNRMYQAGVDAAKGLVDGLNSLSAELDSAATALGNSIAEAIAKALGIHSPSTRLRAMMGAVGDGAVLGLDDQHAKVGRAGARFADRVAVSPEVSRRSADPVDDEVSGNPDSRFRDLVVVTPTKDPVAVAHEVLNEVVGRI